MCLLVFCILCLGVPGLSSCSSTEKVQLSGDQTFLEVGNKHPFRFDWSSSRATVLIFITVDCPIANGYAPEINRLASQYADRGVAFTLVQIDRDLTVEMAQEHAKEFGFVCPVILDPHHRLVKAVGATVTPEAAVIDSHSQLAYRGRIDDQYADLGKKHAEASEHDLAAAIDLVIRGEKVAHPRTPTVGCFIPEPAK